MPVMPSDCVILLYYIFDDLFMYLYLPPSLYAGTLKVMHQIHRAVRNQNYEINISSIKYKDPQSETFLQLHQCKYFKLLEAFHTLFTSVSCSF
jgi:hypothetical protein